MDATTGTITFEIAGDAIPQPRARATRGGQMYTPTKNGIDVFKQAIGLRAAMEAKRRGWVFTTGAVEIFVECVFARPRSHVKAAGGLRATAPAFPGHGCGDWDNLVKGVQDAITKTGAFWKDDTQVIDGRCRKRYAAPGEMARTIVTIRRPDG